MSLDRSAVVLSIRPPFADRILDGTKSIEFRRKPLPKHAQNALIWRTGPGGGIVAAIILGQQTKRPAAAWTHNPTSGTPTLRTGIAPADLYAYAGGPDAPLWGITFQTVRRLPRTCPGQELGFGRAPQSWRYAPLGWRRLLDPAEHAPRPPAEPLVWSTRSGALLLDGRAMTQQRAIFACLTHTRNQIDESQTTPTQITYYEPSGAVRAYAGTHPDLTGSR
jgi:predicted transcriptional regulator